MNYLPDKLAENEYYHGTAAYSAIQILYEGFRLKKNYCDSGKYGTFKQGIYLTKSLNVADLYSHGYIFKCQIKQGTSILWLNDDYDKNIIKYLGKEFSKSILTGPISKAIPHNKNLTKKELIHLLNYRFCKVNHKKRRDFQKRMKIASSFRQQLNLHKYDGVGETQEEAGLVIFNPSFVKQTQLLNTVSEGGKTNLGHFNAQQLANEVEKHCNDMVEYFDSQESSEEIQHLRLLRQKFCQENGLV
jgi:hypothetical protein